MDLMDLVVERVRILFEGVWKEKQVRVVENNEKYLSEITAEMLEVARVRFASKKEKNPKLFDGDAFHLNLKCSIILPNKVVLTVGKMKYSIYDIARKEYLEKYGWKTIPSGMGTSAVVLTKDSKIVMHNRFSHIDHAAKISTIGGIYSGKSPFENIKQELREELQLEKKEIKKLFLIGIYTRLNERVNHGLSFFVETTLPSEEIIRREQYLSEKEGGIFFLGKDSEAWRDYLMVNRQQILSDGFVGLILAGRYLWGKNWSKVKNEVE